MLNKIKQFFEQNISSPTASQLPIHQVQLATAALLIEMMHQDDQVKLSEQQAVNESLMQHFQLSKEEVEQLCQLAEQELHQSTDYYQFTKLITEHFTQQQKISVIELLWRVALADNELDAYEEHMVRRIAELIYVPHQAFIQAKLKVQNELV